MGKSGKGKPFRLGLVILSALIVLFVHTGALWLEDPDYLSANCGDELSFFSYLLAAGKEPLVFPALQAERMFPVRALALHQELLRTGCLQPRSGWGPLLAYAPHALAMRLSESFWAIKLWPLLNLTIIYLCWALVAARFGSRLLSLTVLLLFLFPPFNFRYTVYYASGTQEVSLLFTSLFFWSLSRWQTRPAAGRVLLSAGITGLGIAFCLKNAIDLLTLGAGLFFLWRRRMVAGWLLTAAAVVAAVAYLPLPLTFMVNGISPLANISDRQNMNLAGDWRTPEGLIADLDKLGGEAAKSFVYQLDLAPGILHRISMVFPLMFAGALLWYLTANFRLWRRRPDKVLPLRPILGLYGVMFIFVYILGPVRLYDIEHIAALTSYRYFASLYPVSFILFGWLLLQLSRRVCGTGGAKLHWLNGAIMLAVIMAYPVWATGRHYRHSCRQAGALSGFRAVQTAPLGWLLARTNPSLPIADAERRIMALAERRDDVFSISREFFRYRFYAEPIGTGTVNAAAAQIVSAEAALGFWNALGTHFVEQQYPVPAAALPGDVPRCDNEFACHDLIDSLPAEQFAEFWRGVGYGDAALREHYRRFEKTGVPDKVLAAMQKIPPSDRAWYLEGVGETLMHSHYQVSLRWLQYDFYFDVRSAAAILSRYAPEYAVPLHRGFARAVQRFRVNDGAGSANER